MSSVSQASQTFIKSRSTEKGQGKWIEKRDPKVSHALIQEIVVTLDEHRPPADHAFVLVAFAAVVAVVVNCLCYCCCCCCCRCYCCCCLCYCRCCCCYFYCCCCLCCCVCCCCFRYCCCCRCYCCCCLCYCCCCCCCYCCCCLCCCVCCCCFRCCCCCRCYCCCCLCCCCCCCCCFRCSQTSMNAAWTRPLVRPLRTTARATTGQEDTAAGVPTASTTKPTPMARPRTVQVSCNAAHAWRTSFHRNALLIVHR